MKNRICILLAMMMLSIANTTAQQLFINEFMASNSYTIADENGDFEDWIEIYNQGSTVVNLSGYGLSDDVTEPFRWVFPGVSI